jgi:septum formation protein
MNLILASASPRRKELLNKITDDFLCIPADIDETVPENEKAENAPEYLSLKKAEFIAESYPNSIVLGSDTGVFCDGVMLGKPCDRDDAVRMLKMLSGRTHSVITGCALVKGDKKVSFSCETKVTFYELSDMEIENYVSTGECDDKAGAYGIQGKGALLIKEIKGDYFNVVGLPVAMLYRELTDFEKNSSI